MKRAAWQVYLLTCRDGSLYAGCTNDLARRLAAHSAGKGARYTRSRRPVRLAWTRRVKDRSAALSLEAHIKRLTREEKLALVAGTFRLSARRVPARGRASSSAPSRRPSPGAARPPRRRRSPPSAWR